MLKRGLRNGQRLKSEFWSLNHENVMDREREQLAARRKE
jgi:hypothetical protein